MTRNLTCNTHNSLVLYVWFLKEKNRFDVQCGVKHRRKEERGLRKQDQGGSQQKQEIEELDEEECKLYTVSWNLGCIGLELFCLHIKGKGHQDD